MSFRILPSSLHATAEAAAVFFKSRIGVRRFDVEESIHDDVDYRPTLSGQTRDFHILCVEVSECAYPRVLDSAVMDMRRVGLPVRLFVAMPTGVTDPDFQRNLKKAKDHSVGIVQVGSSGENMSVEALSQSLAGLRYFASKDFPPKYRQEIDTALSTFLNGNPSQGCNTIYSEIEDLTRRMAKKADGRGYWRTVRHSIRGVDFQNGPWARVVEKLRNEFNRSSANCPDLSVALWNRVAGITGHRNDTVHKPKNRASLIKRDKQLRTRFETAMDILAELITASKPLKV
jgi:hypothetical protein